MKKQILSTNQKVGTNAAIIGGKAGEGMKLDRKSTRLNSSHRCISYAVFCLKKKKKKHRRRLYNKETNLPIHRAALLQVQFDSDRPSLPHIVFRQQHLRLLRASGITSSSVVA